MSDHYGNITIASQKDKSPVAAKQNAAPLNHPPTPGPRHPRVIRKRYILIPLVVMVVMILFYGLNFFLIPLIIEEKAVDLFSKETGLVVEIGSIKSNPFLCSLDLKEISIVSAGENDTHSDVLHIKNLYIDLNLISLLRNSIVTEKLELEGMTLNLQRHTNNHFNLSPFFAQYRKNSSDILDFAELPFLYSLNNISIVDGTIIFNDLITEKVHRIENLSLSLPTVSNFSYAADNYIQPRFSAVINGSPIELVAESSPSAEPSGTGSATTLSCTLKAINIPLYAHYLPLPLPVEITQGTADSKIQISFLPSSDKGRHLVVNYQFNARDIMLYSHDGAITLASPVLSMEGSITPHTGLVELKNVLLRDPKLTVKKSFSKATVDSLFLNDQEDTISTTSPLLLPSVVIPLLIADNGVVIIEKEKAERTFHSVQLSIRDFANAIAIRRNMAPATGNFRLTGALDNDVSTFSWQGNFTNTVPAGNLEINNLALTDVLAVIDPQTATNAEGTVDIRGRLTANRSTDVAQPVFFSFSEGTLQAATVSLTEKSKEWFNGPSVRFEPVTFSKGDVQLGNIFLENGRLQLTADKLPLLMQRFMAGDKHRLSGIDMQGDIILEQQKNSPTPWHLTGVHLQMTNLDKKDLQDNNLAFSAESLPRGKITVQGRISLAPGVGSLELAFSDLPANSLYPWLSSHDFVIGDDISINGSGTYQLSTKKFKGALDIKNGMLENTSTQNRYSFSRGLFEGVSINSDFSSIEGNKIIADIFHLTQTDLEIATARVTVSGLAWQRDKCTIDELDFSESDISLLPRIPDFLRPMIDDSKKEFKLKKLTMAGKLNLLNDQKEKSPFFESFQLAIDDLSEADSRNDNISLQAGMADRGEMQIHGGLAVNPLKTKLTAQLTNVEASVLHRLKPPSRPSLMEATVNGSIEHLFPEGIFTGSISLSDGRFYPEKGATPFTWKKATLDEFNIQESPFRLGMHSLDLDTPQAELTLKETDIYGRIHELVNHYLPKETAPGGTSSDTAPAVDITKIGITDGAVLLRDERMAPAWQAPVFVYGDLHAVRFTDSNQDFAFKLGGKVQETTPFSLDGSAHLSPETASIDHNLQITGFPLRAFAQQLQDTVDIDTADATFDLHYLRMDSSPEKRNTAKFTFASLQARNNAEQTELLLALLTDSEHRISQEISLKQDTPLFSQSAVNFQRMLVKSNVSPFLLLPSPYNALGEGSEIIFPPGESDLSEDGEIILAEYAGLIKARPLLRLGLETVVSRTYDRPALLARLEREEKVRVEQENDMLLRQWQQHQIKVPQAAPSGGAIAVREIPAEELKAFTPVSQRPVKVDDAMLTELAKQRSENIVSLLKNQHAVAEENITSLGKPILRQGKTEEKSSVHLSLGPVKPTK